MHHAIIAGKAVLGISKRFNLGAGSTWPGHVALKLDKNFVRKVIDKNSGIKVILIAGTNGKTTTTKALAHVLERFGYSVITNEAGANLLNGLATLIAKNVSLSGKLKHKAIIFEVDENTLPNVLSQIPNPSCIVMLNLFRDQLDRYGEVNTTAEKWGKAIQKLDQKTLVVANTDDPVVSHTASLGINTKYFTVDAKYRSERTLEHAVDSTTCPKCNSPLNYISISYSHLGNYLCEKCGFKNHKTTGIDIKTSLLGSYNQYNLNAALCVLKNIFGIKESDILESFESLKPAFGRQEIIEVDNKEIMLLLSKNPTGFNQSLKVASCNSDTTLLLILNDRVPDGRDISWIWDVDFENLRYSKKKIIVSGDRCYDMSNRLLFANVSHIAIENPKKALNESLKITGEGKRLTILPTYSAMLEIRKEISGKKIL